MCIKKIVVAALLSLSLAGAVQAGESVICVKADGTKATYALATVRSFVPKDKETESASFTLNFNNGKASESGYTKVLFKTSTDNEDLLSAISATQLYVFPNPVQNELQISGVDENAEVILYDLSGEQLLRQQGTRVEVSALVAGTYIVRVGGVALRFIKR